jgi:hypothetical protein
MNRDTLVIDVDQPLIAGGVAAHTGQADNIVVRDFPVFNVFSGHGRFPSFGMASGVFRCAAAIGLPWPAGRIDIAFGPCLGHRGGLRPALRFRPFRLLFDKPALPLMAGRQGANPAGSDLDSGTGTAPGGPGIDQGVVLAVRPGICGAAINSVTG